MPRELSSLDMPVYFRASHLCFVRRQTPRALRSCGSRAPCRLAPPLHSEVSQQQHLVGNTSQGTQTRASHWLLPLGPPRPPGDTAKKKSMAVRSHSPAGLTCLKEAAAGMPNACLSSFTSCQALRASHRLMNPGDPFTTANTAHIQTC